MSDDAGADVDPTASAVLQVHFGHYWRAWRWVRRQFTPTSLTLLGGILVAAGGYIAHLREDYVEVRTRVVVLETRVVPVLQDQSEIKVIETRLDEHGDRISRLEGNYDYAQKHAGDAPTVRRRRGQ